MEAFVDLALLAPADFIDRRLHVVVSTALGDAAESTRKVWSWASNSISWVWVRYARRKKGAAVTELEVRDLQLGPTSCRLSGTSLRSSRTGRPRPARKASGTYARPCWPGWHPASRSRLSPVAGKGRDPIVGTVETQRLQDPGAAASDYGGASCCASTRAPASSPASRRNGIQLADALPGRVLRLHIALLARYFLIVFRDNPVRSAISFIDSLSPGRASVESRSIDPRLSLLVPTCSSFVQERGTRGSIFDANVGG